MSSSNDLKLFFFSQTDGDVEGVKLDSGEPSGANEGVKIVTKRESRA